jgi:hypothetical protein
VSSQIENKNQSQNHWVTRDSHFRELQQSEIHSAQRLNPNLLLVLCCFFHCDFSLFESELWEVNHTEEIMIKELRLGSEEELDESVVHFSYKGYSPSYLIRIWEHEERVWESSISNGECCKRLYCLQCNWESITYIGEKEESVLRINVTWFSWRKYSISTHRFTHHPIEKVSRHTGANWRSGETAICAWEVGRNSRTVREASRKSSSVTGLIRILEAILAHRSVNNTISSIPYQAWITESAKSTPSR